MRPELLSPAGDTEKLKTAFLYGADAVYLSGAAFGMRAFAPNFSDEELKEAFVYSRKLGKKAYLTVNTMPHTFEYPKLGEYLSSLKECPPDALIVSDPGVFSLSKKILPDVDIHISTQANVLSAEGCLFWYGLGAKRVVLGREVTLDEIKEIRKNVPEKLELEVFVHGSMCVSYSGRCLISGNLASRDANRGMCAQPCRWDYKLYEIEEKKRPGERMTVEETPIGTFIMASKDMCMIEHIPELCESGVNCFKIEGRMRSAYYTACVTNAYRAAIDSYYKDKNNYVFDPLLLRELDSVSHREYCTGYFFDSVRGNAQLSKGNKSVCEQSYLAYCDGYDENKGLGVFLMRNKFSEGDKVELLSPSKTGRPFVISEIYGEDGNRIPSAPHPYMKTYIRVPFVPKKGDILRSAFEENL